MKVKEVFLTLFGVHQTDKPLVEATAGKAVLDITDVFTCKEVSVFNAVMRTEKFAQIGFPSSHI